MSIFVRETDLQSGRSGVYQVVDKSIDLRGAQTQDSQGIEGPYIYSRNMKDFNKNEGVSFNHEALGGLDSSRERPRIALFILKEDDQGVVEFKAALLHSKAGETHGHFSSSKTCRL